MDFSKFKSMRQKKGVLALAVKASVAELLIYDVIGEDWFGDGVTAKGVVQQLASLPAEVDTVLVRINSPGGDVFDGIAILNALLQFKGTVNVQVDGLCASIASVIAMAGKTISMAETATLMIHNPWTLAVGDANDMRATADLLDKLRGGSMLPAYARSGLSSEQLTAIMDAETWYTAAEAKAAGWIDQVLAMPTRASAHAKYNLSAFRHPPAALQADSEENDCNCDCGQCEADLCNLCSNADCDDDNCDGCPQQLQAAAAKAAADAEIAAEAVTKAAEGARLAAEAAENDRISAENKQKALIKAQKRAENLRLAADS